MADASSFSATPEKRLAAAFVDFLLIGLAASLAYATADAWGRRLDFEVVLALACFAYHAAFLSLWAGQSPGRRTFDISVVSADGTDLQPWQAVVRSIARPAVIVAAAASMPVAQISRMELGAHLASGILLLESALLLFMASRRTGADFLSGTLVVNNPPPQPHRAPAAPMYSATDAEFGYPPRRPKREKDYRD